MGYDQGKDGDISCKREGGRVEDDKAVEAAAGREGRGAPMSMRHHHCFFSHTIKLLAKKVCLWSIVTVIPLKSGQEEILSLAQTGRNSCNFFH